MRRHASERTWQTIVMMTERHCFHVCSDTQISIMLWKEETTTHISNILRFFHIFSIWIFPIGIKPLIFEDSNFWVERPIPALWHFLFIFSNTTHPLKESVYLRCRCRTHAPCQWEGMMCDRIQWGISCKWMDSKGYPWKQLLELGSIFAKEWHTCPCYEALCGLYTRLSLW